MNFLRITAVIGGRYVESEVHLDTTNLTDVLLALDQMVHQVHTALESEAES